MPDEQIWVFRNDVMFGSVRSSLRCSLCGFPGRGRELSLQISAQEPGWFLLPLVEL